MSSYLRPRIPGASVFFTVALAERGSTLLVDEIEVLRRAVAMTRAERWFEIDAWGSRRPGNDPGEFEPSGKLSGGQFQVRTGGAPEVLPDHLHCVWTLPEGDADFSRRWGAIKARFTRAVRDSGRVGFHPTVAGRNGGGVVGWNPTLQSPSKLRKGDAGIWQRRFWEHHIRDARDYDAHIQYCWINPVKHGFVERPEDWPYSSVHRDVRLGRYGL